MARPAHKRLLTLQPCILLTFGVLSAEIKVEGVRDGGDAVGWSISNGVFDARLSLSGCMAGLKAKDSWLIKDGSAEIWKPFLFSGEIGTPGDYWFSPKERGPETVVRPLSGNGGKQLAFYGHWIWRCLQIRPDRGDLLCFFRVPNHHRDLVEFELAVESRLPAGWSVVVPVNGRPKALTSDSRESLRLHNASLTKQASEKSREAFIDEDNKGEEFPGYFAAYSSARKAALIFRFDPIKVFACSVAWREGRAIVTLVCPRVRLRLGERFSFPTLVGVHTNVGPEGMLKLLSEPAPEAVPPGEIQPAEADVLHDPTDLPEILKLLRQHDCDVLCTDANYELQGSAIKSGRRFGLSVSCQRYTYGNAEHLTWPMAYRERPICVIGPPGVNPLTTLVDRMAFTCNEEFPGKGKGVIKLFRKLPMSPHPVVVVSGSDREGTQKAVELLLSEAGDYQPPELGDFYLYAEDPMLWTHTYSVTKQEAKLKRMALSGARGERSVGRLVLRAGKAISGLKIEAEPLSLVDGTGGISRPRIFELRADHDLDDGAYILDPRIRPEIPARLTRGYWVEFDIPGPAAPGTYQGEIKVSSKEYGTRVLPVELQVWDFAIPERSPIAVTMWNLFPNEAPGPRIFEPDPSKVEDDAAFCALVDNLRAHEVNVDSSFYPMQYCRWVENEKGEIEFDYSTFDRYMEFTERRGLNRGTMLYYVFHGRAGKIDPDRFVCLKYSPGRMAYLGRDGQEKRFKSKFAWAKVAQRYNRDFIEHLKTKEWYDRCFVVIGDEPGDYPRWRKEVLPYHRMGIKFITAMGHSSFGGEKHVDDVHKHWIVHQWHARGPEARPFVKRRFEQGDTLWWYECKGDHLISHDLAPMRSLAFDLWREHIRGFGRYWYGGPLVCQEEEPRIRNSISWELFRKGIEDYKILWVLDSRIRMAEALGRTDVAAEARKRMDELLTSLPNTYQLLGESRQLRFAAIRQQLAEMILSLKDYAWNPAFYSWRQKETPNWCQAVSAAKDFASSCPAGERPTASELVRELHRLALLKHSGELAEQAGRLAPLAGELAEDRSELRVVSDYLGKLGFEAAGLRLEVIAALPTATATSPPRAIQGQWHEVRLRVSNAGNAPLSSAAAMLSLEKGVEADPAGEIQFGDVPAGAKRETGLKIRFTDQFRRSSAVLKQALRYTRKALTNVWQPAGLAMGVQLDLAIEEPRLAGRSFRPLSLSERRFVNNVFPVQFAIQCRNNTTGQLDVRLRPDLPDGWACQPDRMSVALPAGQAKEVQFALKLVGDIDPPRGEGRLALGISYGQVSATQSFALPYQGLQEWAIIGPFQVMPGLSTNFISYPEKPVSLSKPCARPSGLPVRWRTVPMEDGLDFAYLFGKYADERLGPLVGPNFAVAFAHSFFHSTREQTAQIEVVSESKCTVWINRKLAFPVGKEAEDEAGADDLLTGDEDDDEEEQELELEDGDEKGVLIRKGWNEICVKCQKETEQSWEARLLFKPVDASDKAFRPPEAFVVRP